MSDSEDKTIVPLRPTGEEPKFRMMRGGGVCFHKSRIIDDNARTVECATCKAVLDPFAELSRIASDHERFFNEEKRRKESVRGLAARYQTLKKLEANARSRLKRLGVEVKNECAYGNDPRPFTVTKDGEHVLVAIDETPLRLSKYGAMELARSIAAQADRPTASNPGRGE